MSKFHITKTGRTEPCGATKRACPLGEANHYDSFDAAAKAAITDGFRGSEPNSSEAKLLKSINYETPYVNKFPSDQESALVQAKIRERGLDYTAASRIHGELTGSTTDHQRKSFFENLISDKPDAMEQLESYGGTPSHAKRIGVDLWTATRKTSWTAKQLLDAGYTSEEAGKELKGHKTPEQEITFTEMVKLSSV